MSGLKLRDVKKSFGAVEVIKGVDLDIDPKEFVVFVGPSGCGKSTLLRLIAGLEDITSGTIAIGDKQVEHLDPSKRGIAMVFQTYALYPHLTVAENMGFALKFAGHSKEEIDRQVKEAARILELDALLDRTPGQLSGGQRQRVAIGRAIVRKPDVFLFDEPLSNLDAELRVHTRLEIAGLHKSLASTMIYVTHDQVEAMTLADKIVVLRAGLVEQVGSPLDLYDDPDNVFVAGFIGSPKMNFLKGEITDGGVRLLEFSGQIIPMPSVKSKLSSGTKVTVGIRPEHFSKGGDAELTVNVEMVENLGGDIFVYGRGAQGPLVTIKSTERGYEAGQSSNASFPSQAALLFDEHEQRIR